MKILRIIARLNVGGPARHVVWLTEALNDEEFETLLVAGTVPPGEEDMSYFAAEHGVTPHYISEMSRELSAKDIVAVWKIYREMRKFSPDVVHTHTAKAGTVGRTAAFAYKWFTLGALIGKPRKVKIVHTFHGHVFHSYYGKLKTAIFLFIEKWLAFFATDTIVVITDQQFKEINGDFSIGRPSQFRVIPLGIDLSEFRHGNDHRSSFRKEMGVGDDETLIAFVGRLTEIKNIPLFLKAAEICLSDERKERPVRFVIIGAGHLREELDGEAARLGIHDKVIFAGNRNDTPKIYSALDVICLTSLNEGTPLSLIEAMAAGTPIVSTSVGGVVDLLGSVIQEINGYSICERGISAVSGDAEGMANGIRRCTADRDLGMKLAAAGREFVDKKYSKDRLVNDIKELYGQNSAAAHTTP
jgi:glycosyltransferase involved in cell wall biosynthesis